MKKQKNSMQKTVTKDLFKTVARATTTKKTSEYGRQLIEKQKVKKMYGMREAQFRRFFLLSKKSKDSTGETLLTLLESRLDNIIYRLKFAKTRLSARKMIVYGHIKVNGKRVYSPSILLKVNDIVELNDRTKTLTSFMHNEIDIALAKINRVPDWLELNRADYRGVVLRKPISSDIQAAININAIVELYSK